MFSLKIIKNKNTIITTNKKIGNAHKTRTRQSQDNKCIYLPQHYRTSQHHYCTTPLPTPTTMHAFVVNLDRDTKRLGEFQKDWKDITSINITRFPAIKGSEIRHTPQVAPICQEHCTDGMIGCAASHLALMYKMIRDNIPVMMVLEDDAYPCTDFDQQWNTIQAQFLPNDFDILLLGAGGWSKPSIMSPFFQLIYGRDIREYKKINSKVIVPANPTCTYGYLISQKGAKKIIEKYNIIRNHIDVYLFSRDDLQLYALDNPIVFTHDSDASLGNNYTIRLPESIEKLRWMDNRSPTLWILHAPCFQIHGRPILTWHLIFIVLILLIGIYITLPIALTAPILLVFFIITIVIISIVRQLNE